MGHSGAGGEGERKAAGGSNLSLDNSAFFCNSSSLCSPKRLFSSWRKGAMQNKSLFESPPSLFVPNGQRLSSPSPTKDSSDAEFSSPSNPLQPAPPGHKASKSLASKTRSRQEQPPKQRSLSRSQLPLTQCGVWAVCVCLGATPVGAISALSEPPNSSSVQHNRSRPPQMVSSSLPGWKGAAEGGERRFSSSSQLLPSPPLSQPLSESPPLPPLPPTVKRQ